MMASNSALKSHVFLTRASSFVLLVYISARELLLCVIVFRVELTHGSRRDVSRKRRGTTSHAPPIWAMAGLSVLALAAGLLMVRVFAGP
jgi:hypothetical protein|tara:strand:+ start:31 stop:297 length:267 start_codon:yes stop_codon:yes gene_type:complete